jgi:branched-chain amino acid aminotransferase
MDLARDKNIAVIERDLFPEDLAKASEVFLTGTAAEVTPVRQIAEHHYTPGAVTRTLADAYETLVRVAPGRSDRIAA